MAKAFNRAFGDTIEFTTQTGLKTFEAIVREEADLLNAGGGGVGTIGDIATVKLATVDAVFLAEEDTFIHQGITFQIAGAPEHDGRGMTSFEITRAEQVSILKPKEHLILVRKQLKIARDALKKVRDGNGTWSTAECALDEIESIQSTQIGHK